MADFLLEIGSEEVPSRFLKKEESDLVSLMEAALDSAALPHKGIEAWATPRRAAVLVRDIAPVQAEREEIVMGPPARIAYGADGKPTAALTGFAKTNKADIGEVFKKDTDKGEYMAIIKKTGGKTAKELLPDICAHVIQSLVFPKSMRWGANEISYARPLRWILALLDKEIIPFTVGPVASSNQTWGHRIHGPGPFTVESVYKYWPTLEEKCQVLLDPAKRRELIVAKGDALAREKGGTVLWNDSLLEEVDGLVEHPVPLLGDFDPAYLEVPDEALLTSMESHQKSFGLRDANGKLLPHFITVLNTTPEDMAVVKRGWERVLRARLEDARFFWRSDRADSFDNWLEKLEHVIFIGPLGSMGDKSRRLETLCSWLAGEAALEAGQPQLAARAGRLAKADLVSGMVGEFDSLQGIMGGIYAEKAGENSAVAQAIKEQYLPAGPDSPLPKTWLGSLLSIADKADTLAGCFGLNMIPTGAADPNGLRRCALGIIRILLDRDLDISLRALFVQARQLYGDQKWKLPREECLNKLSEFLAGRLKNYFLGLGYNTLLVDSALAAGADRIPDCKARLDALAAFAARPDYEKNVQTLKRIENIVKKGGGLPDAWRDDLLREAAEKELAAELDKILPQLDQALGKGDYAAALDKLEETRQPVDAFFENIMVNCDEADLRKNRLALLNALLGRFKGIAEFAMLQI